MTGITFAQQDQLQKLPIPPLEETVKKYLAVLKPLQTPREHQNTEEAVKNFLETSGPLLQEELIKYASTRSSFIEQFWYDSYLNYDSPVVLNLNPFFLLEDDSTPYSTTQVQRAATLTTSSLRFIRALRREELPPDAIRGKNLCMYQYSRLFGSSRIPTSSGCVMQSDTTSRHIVVACHSQFYWFDVLDDNNDLIMTEPDMAVNFQSIIDDARQTPITEAAKGAVGVMTTENRRIWASIRDSMTRDEDTTNNDCIKIIDSALFVVCLDHAAPESLSDLARNMLCGLSVIEKGVQVGTCTNRWYDKLQIIVTENAKAGINFEHTGVDGHTVLRYVSDIYTDTILRFAKSINGQSPSLWASTSPDPSKRDPNSFGDVTTTPHKLEWSMVPELTLPLRFAETGLADLIEQNDFQALEFQHYGMKEIKNMGFSPDAFVQMAFQAAYYALYGKVECTYEPAMTKRFLHGRTEAIRTVSEASAAFVRKFCEDAPAAQKIEFLRKACDQHTVTTRNCSAGLGQDRHLYGLFCIWKRYLDEEDNENTSQTSSNSDTIANGQASSSKLFTKEIPSIFADPGWDKLNNTIMSTSNCGNPALKLFGFGPTSPEGYGLGYIIKEDTITICASSKHRQTQRLLDTLNSYFMEIRSLWRQSTVKKAAPVYGTRARSHERLPKLAAPAPVHPHPVIGRTVGASHTPRTLAHTADEEISYLLGGYGYFDISDYQEVRTRAASPEPPFNVNASRREIGRKLRLAEY
jgi:carnitine O-acetyltransferase